jgi:glucose/mannose-6-phosphate isomerase
VGAADVVIAVSASGRSPEALGAADAAARRGARLVAVGAPDSELQAVAERARAPFIAVPRRAPARASMWSLTVPVLMAARALGLVKVNEADLAETAARLDADAERCRPTAESFVNPGKALALDLAGSVPIIWGSSPLATVAARRFADTLSANARYPAVAGSLGEAGRGRVGLLDGVYGGLAEAGRDIFADPADLSADGPTRLRLVVLRDGGLTEEDEDAENEPIEVEERRAEAVQAIAERRGIRVSVLTAEGASPLERLASLVAVPDFASIYLAMAHGLDPMAVPAVSEVMDFLRP